MLKVQFMLIVISAWSAFQYHVKKVSLEILMSTASMSRYTIWVYLTLHPRQHTERVKFCVHELYSVHYVKNREQLQFLYLT